MEAEQGAANLKAQVHAKLLLVGERLEGLVDREARHAKRRGARPQTHKHSFAALSCIFARPALCNDAECSRTAAAGGWNPCSQLQMQS